MNELALVMLLICAAVSKSFFAEGMVNGDPTTAIAGGAGALVTVTLLVLLVWRR